MTTWHRTARLRLCSAALAAIALSSCDKSPTAPAAPEPQPTGPASASIVSLLISGPTSLEPRGRGTSTGQYRAVATRSDGSTSDVTASAAWTTSAFSVVHPTGRAGEFQAEARGEAVITATFAGVAGYAGVLVLENGTFKLAGRVIDVDRREPLPQVRVTIDAGKGSGLTAYSNAKGEYALYGAAGPIELSASSEGFLKQTQSLVIAGALTRDLVLSPLVAPVDISGAWTLAISASVGCRDQLPEMARDRQYAATITQKSARIDMTLTGPTIETVSGLVGVPLGEFREIYGTVVGDRVSFTIVGDTAYDGFSSVDFIDHLSALESLGISATAKGTLAGGEIRTTLAGDIEYWAASPRGVGIPDVVCRAGNHVAILRRR